MERYEPTLDGVSATTLRTLQPWAEAKCYDGVIADPSGARSQHLRRARRYLSPWGAHE
jgi:hypothetical protein